MWVETDPNRITCVFYRGSQRMSTPQYKNVIECYKTETICDLGLTLAKLLITTNESLDKKKNLALGGRIGNTLLDSLNVYTVNITL